MSSGLDRSSRLGAVLDGHSRSPSWAIGRSTMAFVRRCGERYRLPAKPSTSCRFRDPCLFSPNNLVDENDPEQLGQEPIWELAWTSAFDRADLPVSKRSDC
jgi:hypothetical protein